MDVQTAVIGLGVFVVSGLVLFFIYKFGIREKTYEEALAEQRQQTNALLGVQPRPKPKEKKLKKANKKAKEKQAVTIVETTEESEDLENNVNHHKLHVEFQEPTVVEEEIITAPKQLKNVKRGKIRPILVNKSEAVCVKETSTETVPANHFEQLHPKDDIELLHSQSHVKEDTKVEKVNPKPKAEKEKKVVKQNSTELKEQTKPKVEKNKENAEVTKNKLHNDKVAITNQKQEKPVPNQNQPDKISNQKQQEKSALGQKVQSKPAPQKQPDKASSNQKQQEKSASTLKQPEKAPVVNKKQHEEQPPVEVQKEKVAVPVVQQVNGYVTAPVKEKKKKKVDNNMFYQLAGSKNPEITLEMLQSVVRKAELTRSEVQILIDLLLNKQHEAPEVIDEWTEGKADPVQKLKKQLAEKEKLLLSEQEAFLGAQIKLKEIRAEFNTEKIQLQQRLRGLEEILQTTQFELQAANNHIQTQAQSLQQVNVQLNEERTNIQMQRQQFELRLQQMQEAEASIVQLRNEVTDLQGRNQQLTMEMHSLTEQNLAKEHQQGIIVQLQHQVNHFKAEADQKDEIYKELEETRRNLDHQINLSHRQENELKIENSHLKTTCQKQAEEVRRLELTENQAMEKLRVLSKQKEEADHLLGQLKTELRDMQTEKTELQALKANGIAQATKSYQEDVLNLHNELSSLKHKFQHTESQHTADLELTGKLQKELEEQRSKNNELREKNWKVMEALNAAERRIKLCTDSRPAEDLVVQIREQNREFLRRLFPEVTVEGNDVSHDKWLSIFEESVKNHLRNLKEQSTSSNQSSVDGAELTRLQGQVDHYKKAIDETEAILKKLEDHIVREETNWRRQLQVKDAEIEGLKQTMRCGEKVSTSS